jgi:predicted NAD/FAD-binding protein
MKIAIVGAGVSGLATAHLLHREHEIDGLRGRPRRGGHANTVAGGHRGRHASRGHGLHRASTTATTRTSRSCWRAERASQPSDMSFGVSDGGDFEYNGSSPNGLFAKRAHLVTPWFHRMIADLVRFNATRKRCSRRRRGPSLGHWLDAAATRGRSSSG